MGTSCSNPPISVRAGFYIHLCLCILLLPIHWVIAWMAAATVHELSHCLCLRLLKVRIYHITISSFGAKIQTEFISEMKQFVASLAGPAGGLLLLLLSNWFPRLAICGFLQSVYNLVPIYPLDGGRALCAVILRLFPGVIGTSVFRAFNIVILTVISLLGLYSVFVLGLGPIPILVAGLLVIRNITCNARKQKVQY